MTETISSTGKKLKESNITFFTFLRRSEKDRERVAQLEAPSD